MFKYHVVLAAGCHGQTENPIVSRHKTLEAAVRKARRSDRLAVEPADSYRTLYRAQSKQPTQCGWGCYGGPDTRSLRECVAEARRNEG